MDRERNLSITLPMNSILFIVFLILKLCGVINWSWIWVFSPIWIPIIAFLVGFVIYFIITERKR